MKEKITLVIAAAMVCTTASARQWTLAECISYALENNIQIQKTVITRRSAVEDLKQAQASLLPSLSAQTSQQVNYTPWIESGISGEGYSRSSIDKVYYNGSYGVNASYTIFDGSKRQNQVKLSRLAEQAAAIDSATQALSVEEQIARLYVQILYSAEAVTVSKETLANSQANEERGRSFVENGKMSKADMAQLTAQVAQDQYSLVSAESQVADYKRQLKQLLQITSDDFDVVTPQASDAMALSAIPSVSSVYEGALAVRPELKSYQNAIDQSKISMAMAKATSLPTLSANGGVTTSTTSMNSKGWGQQLKNNFNIGAGVTLSIPIFDQRQKKTAYNKAVLQQQNAMLDLKNEQTTLYSTIESYWLQATNNQNQFRAATVSTKSAQESYDLVSEKFKEGLSNIVEVRTAKDKLLQSRQNELQAKYLAILNIDMLNFYRDGKLRE